MFFEHGSILLDALFQPYRLSDDLTLKNSIVMAPMTRNLASDDFVPNQAMAEYYAKRADAGLIITEATIIAEDAGGYANVPGIFRPDQIDGWHRVTDAVHVRGGRIFLQIWHAGRVSHPDFLKGALPISPSKTVMTGHFPRSNGLNFGSSREATRDEIKRLIDEFQTAAGNAIEAGFDGVEIHGANGYLVDQFLHYHTNKRTDEYGGSPENMARFALDVVNACTDAIGHQRVGLRLSPGAYLNELEGDLRDGEVFKYLLKQLNAYCLAYVHTGAFDDKKTFPELENKTMTSFIREHSELNLIACGSYTAAQANHGIQEKKFDLIAVGRPFLANPDLIHLLRNRDSI